jgi:hypothetical protein
MTATDELIDDYFDRLETAARGCLLPSGTS